MRLFSTSACTACARFRHLVALGDRPSPAARELYGPVGGAGGPAAGTPVGEAAREGGVVRRGCAVAGALLEGLDGPGVLTQLPAVTHPEEPDRLLRLAEHKSRGTRLAHTRSIRGHDF